MLYPVSKYFERLRLGRLILGCFPGAKPASNHDPGCVDRSVRHVHLAIELDSEPIRGLVSETGAQDRSFSGWIELVEAIEDARLGDPAVRDLRNARGAKD